MDTNFNATTAATIAGGAIVTGLFLQSVRPMPIYTPDEEELFGDGTCVPDPAAAGAPWVCALLWPHVDSDQICSELQP